jgi:hypothetical protein
MLAWSDLLRDSFLHILIIKSAQMNNHTNAVQNPKIQTVIFRELHDSLVIYSIHYSEASHEARKLFTVLSVLFII